MRSRRISSRSRCGPFYRPGKLWVLAPLSHRIRVDPGKKACFLVRQPDGDSFRDFGDHFRRALGWPSFAKPPTLANAMFPFLADSIASIRAEISHQAISFHFHIPAPGKSDTINRKGQEGIFCQLIFEVMLRAKRPGVTRILVHDSASAATMVRRNALKVSHYAQAADELSSLR